MSRTHRQLSLAVTESSQIGQARRSAAALAKEQGFDEAGAGRVALVATEAAGNIVKHAGGRGQIVLRALQGPEGAGVEVLALDRGPGLSAPARCFEDGFSTAGSPGTGLGAISRLAEVCDVYSQQGKGTALVAQLFAAKAGSQPRYLVGAVCLPIKGETVSGDGWDFHHDHNRALLLVADGLGHGAAAAVASEAAVASFRSQRAAQPTQILETAHDALRSTRGAAVAVAELLPEAEQLNYAGIGNIGGSIVSMQESRSLVSQNGTLGLQMRRVQAFNYGWHKRALLIMYSDGLLGRWSLSDYPGLMLRHPSLIAGVLYRDFSRGRDDVTVVVVRENW